MDQVSSTNNRAMALLHTVLRTGRIAALLMKISDRTPWKTPIDYNISKEDSSATQHLFEVYYVWSRTICKLLLEGRVLNPSRF